MIIDDLYRRPVDLPTDDGPGLADEVPRQPRSSPYAVERRQHNDFVFLGWSAAKSHLLGGVVGYPVVTGGRRRGPVLSLASAAAAGCGVLPWSLLLGCAAAAAPTIGPPLLLVLAVAFL